MDIMTLDEAIKSIPALNEKLDEAVELIRLQTEKIDELEKKVGGEKRFSTKEAARYLGIDQKTLMRRVKYAGLPRHQPGDGGRPWYLKSDIDKWREEQSAEYRLHGEP